MNQLVNAAAKAANSALGDLITGKAFSARQGSAISTQDVSTRVDDVSATASSGYGGHHSGYGTQYVYAEEEPECETGLNPFLLAGTAAIAAGAAYLIFNQVVNGGRRRKREAGDAGSSIMDYMRGVFTGTGIGVND